MKFIALLTLIFSFNSFAKFIEIDIENLNYTKPKSQGLSGDLKFRSVNLSWDGMNINVQNQKNIFDSKIFFKSTYLNFLSPNLKMGFKLEKENSFKEIKGLNIVKSKFIINPQFFSFNGEQFQIVDNITGSRLKLINFNLYCDGNNQFDLTTVDGVLAGCLTNFFVSGVDNTKLADAEIEYRDDSGEVPFYLNSSLDQIELKDNIITAKVAKNYIEAKPFTIRTTEIEANCAKDSEILDFELQDQMIKDCMNNLEIGETKTTIYNDREKSQFKIHANRIKSANERVLIDTKSTTIEDTKKITTLHDLEIICLKEENTDLLELHEVLRDCFKNGHATMGMIDSLETKSNSGNFDINGYFDSDNSSAGKTKYEKSRVRGLRVHVSNYKMDIYAKIKFMKQFDVHIKADIEHYPKQEKIILKITKAGFPLGIEWKWALMKILNKYLVVDFINYGKNRIEIQL